MTKRILVVSQRFWPEYQKINDICEGFISRGVEVDVLCGVPNYPLGDYYPGYTFFKPVIQEHGGLRIFRVPEIRKGKGTNLTIFLNYLSFYLNSFFRTGRLRKNSYDAILVFQSCPASVCSIAYRIARKNRTPVTVCALQIWPDYVYREMDIRNPLLRKIFSKISSDNYLKADMIAVTSEKALRYFRSDLQIPENRAVMIPFAPDRVLLDEDRDNTLLEKYAGSFNIVYTGDISHEQDFDTVVAAARMLVNAGIRDIRFIISGSGNAFGSLRSQIDSEHLNDYFFLEKNTRMENIPKYFYVADVLLGLRRPDTMDEYYDMHDVADYMAAGRPLIMMMGSAVKMLVSRAGCGIGVEAEDAEGLFDAIMKLYKTRQLSLKEMGLKAKAYQKEHFDRDKSIDNLLDIMLGRYGRGDEENKPVSGIIMFNDDE